MPDEIQIQYEFHSIRFAAADDGNLALTSGTLKARGVEGLFGLALVPNADAEWQLKDIRSTGDISDLLSNKEVLQPLVNQAARLLKTINVWPGESASETGAKLVLNERLVPPEVAEEVFISFRPDMLSLPTSNWENLWALIEGRVENDRFFRVHGFSVDKTMSAISQLKQLFQGDWVRARYKKTYGMGNNPHMAADLPRESDGWFPAYHLARTALGAICIDPGWNYLIEIGLSIQELEGFNRLDELKHQVVRSSGTQHHLCLAAELYRKGHLLSLEPQTESGGSTNDLRTKIGEREYEIEVKEFSSKEPGKQLAKQLKIKNQKLPGRPRRPIVFHAVLVEDGIFDKAREDRFFNEVQTLRDSIPAKISAIVAGRRFVDSSGGRVKRDAEYRILNPKALVPSNNTDLKTLFSRNYDSIKYPMFGVGSFFYFGIGNSSDELSKQKDSSDK